VEEEKILKIHPEWMENYVDGNHHALQELYALRDSGWESRHIAYELIEKEIHLIEGKRRGMEVYKKIDMTRSFYPKSFFESLVEKQFKLENALIANDYEESEFFPIYQLQKK